MVGTWLVLLPPLLVIASVIATKRMLFSFMVGLFSAALIATDGNVMKAGLLAGKKLYVSAGLDKLTSLEAFFSGWNLLIFMFLITLGILIALLSQTGAAQAYARLVRTKVKSKKSVEIASLLLSLLFFIDDYFSALTVGSVMRPLALHYQLHPVKLAFLVTAMATPLTIISPLSSWVGEIILQLKQVGIAATGPKTLIAADPYMVFMVTIPCILYPLLLIVSTWYIVIRGISYGPMAIYDKSHVSSSVQGDLQEQTKSSLIDFLLPLLLLIGGVFIMLLYTGGFWCEPRGIVHALKNACVHQALFVGGIISLVTSCFYFLVRKLLRPRDLVDCFKKGFILMFPSILMLICAWALGNILKNDLETGSYIASLVCSCINMAFFPLISFLFAAAIAMMIGSAWATIGLMFPIIIDMLQKILHILPNTPLDSLYILLPILGATLSGCVIGTQLSVISDNPIMSSASTGANHLEHVKTMAWYCIPVGIATAASYIFIGHCLEHIGLKKCIILALIFGLTLSFVFLESCNYMYKKRSRIR